MSRTVDVTAPWSRPRNGRWSTSGNSASALGRVSASFSSRASAPASTEAPPRGNFTARPSKARKHYSSRYNNAYMPFSVQVTGHIFIHGFNSVPNYPACHGCIRLPYLTDGDPARFFYEWIDKGTPIAIVRE